MGVSGFAARVARLYGLGAAREYGRQAWLLAAGTVVSYLGRGAAIPFVTLYLTGHAGIALAVIGLGVMAEQMTRALLSPVFGGWSDRFGRKPFMVAGVLLQGVTFPAYLLVESVPSYLVVSVLAGLGQAPYQPALSAFLADVTPRRQRVGVFGLVHMTKNLGWGLGVLLGGLLVTRSFPLLFAVGGALPVLYGVLLALLLREPPRHANARHARKAKLRRARGKESPTWVAVLRERRFLAFLGLATVIFLTWGQLNTVLPVFVTKGLLLDETWVTRAFAVNSALIILFQVPVSAHVGEWSRTRGLALAGVTTAAAYALLAASAGVAAARPDLAGVALLGCIAVLTLAEMLDTPLTFTLASELAPAGAKGGAMGVLGLAAPVGMALPLFLAGLLTEGAGASWTWVWHAYAGVVLLGSAGFLLLGRRLPAAMDKPQPAPATA